jgi:glutathione S-transferase
MSGGKPFLLYTAGTPNGHVASIFLEELKALYGLDYECARCPSLPCWRWRVADPSAPTRSVHAIDFSKGEQNEPWYIKLNPNGRIPTLVDRTRGDFNVIESAAILLYLQQHYDRDGVFSFDPAKEPNEYSEMMQWLFFVVSSRASA